MTENYCSRCEQLQDLLDKSKGEKAAMKRRINELNQELRGYEQANKQLRKALAETADNQSKSKKISKKRVRK